MPNPAFDQQMQAMVNASGGLLARGGSDRTMEQQIALRIKNGCPDVWNSPASACRIPTAIPGRSMHQRGMAEDVVDARTGQAVKAGSEADKWLAAHAAEFGLHRPVGNPGGKGWEPWHVEPIDADAMGADHGIRDPATIGMTLAHQDMPGRPEDELAYRLESIRDALTAAPETLPQANQPMPAAATDVAAQPEIAPIETSDMHLAAGGEWANGIPPPGFEPAGKGVERWRPVAEAALRYTGYEPTPELVGAMLRRMNQESGGNPRVVNRWDSNARRGDPSTGLMQNIPSAFAQRARELAGRGITDGFANMVASIRYTQGKYGDLMAGWTKKGGY